MKLPKSSGSYGSKSSQISSSTDNRTTGGSDNNNNIIIIRTNCSLIRFNSILILLICLLICLPSKIETSGYFELEFLDGIRNSTQIHVCLKEFWNSQLNLNRCTFGQKTVNFFQHQQQSNQRNLIVKIPFSFRWIGSFSFTVQLTETTNSNNGGNGNNQHYQRSFIDNEMVDRFIVEDEFAIPTGSSINSPIGNGIINDNNNGLIGWKYRTFHANDGRIISIRFRIDCDIYYHSEDCATFCRSRNDTFGHYSCDRNGRKQCLPGWKGENCDKPKCRNGCNEAHGFCENPNECTCRSGWKGLNCDECIPYPGCLHGYCVSPFQCICHRNWGGILCDQDLNYCGTHEPCLNDGRCENIAPDNYRCVCKNGFSGVNCQIIEDACATSPCLHSGTCITLSNGTDFRCLCRNGFSGKRCENDLNECVSQPCLNGATCHDLENNYRCTCPSGWTGDRCELDVDECSALVTPCIKASACININGSYICVCEKGFEGVFCETEVDDCKHNKINCQNGGFCIDLVNDYRCACATGFTGPKCDRIDETVCDLLPNHVWRLNETNDCEKICICQNNTKVICKCQEQKQKQKEEENYLNCNNLEPVENESKKFIEITQLAEIKVIFDSNASRHSCQTIHSIYSLLLDQEDDPNNSMNGRNDPEVEEDEDDEENHFCCNVHKDNGNEVIIKINRNNLQIAQYISRTIFPHILHVVVNTHLDNNQNYNNLRSDHWSIVNLFLILLFSSLISVSAVLYGKSYFKRRQQEVDAENVVIHCIQNNLRSSSSLSSSPPPTTTNSNFNNNHHNGKKQPINDFRPLTPPHKKFCVNSFNPTMTTILPQSEQNIEQINHHRHHNHQVMTTIKKKLMATTPFDD